MTESENKYNQRNLWKEIKAGKTEAFDTLYEQYIDMLFSFGLTFSSDSGLIKDSIHDLFFELYKYRKKLSDTDNIKNYLFKSLKRKIFSNQSKKRKITYAREIADLPDLNKGSVEEDLIHAEQNDEVWEELTKAINNLPHRQREVLTLKFIADLSYTEIAEIMEISVESARTSVYRSLKLIKESVTGKIDSNLILLFFLKLTSAI